MNVVWLRTDVMLYLSAGGAPMGRVPGVMESSMLPAKMEMTCEGLGEDVRSGVRQRIKLMRE
jgi:hypothetical protein